MFFPEEARRGEGREDGLGIGITIREVDYVEIISMSQSRGFRSPIQMTRPL